MTDTEFCVGLRAIAKLEHNRGGNPETVSQLEQAATRIERCRNAALDEAAASCREQDNFMDGKCSVGKMANIIERLKR